MAQASKVRIDNHDEIPIARRINPFSVLYSFRSRFISISIITFISIFLLITAFTLINKSVRDQLVGIQRKGPLSLLGHFPYQETGKDDLVAFTTEIYVHKEIFTPLLKMQKAAAREGIDLVILSGFRSVKLQRQIFYENKSIRNQIAIERAKVSAPPGYSEHSTGYAIDFGDRNYPETHFEESFEKTPSFKWLRANAPKYHFLLSFPKNNKQGVSYEPWHWRYEGTVKALREFEPANQMRR